VVQLGEIGCQRSQVRLEVGPVRRVGLGQPRRHLPSNARHVARIQPDVRIQFAVTIAVLLALRVVLTLVEGLQRDYSGRVEDVVAALLFDRRVHCGLERLLIDHQVGAGDVGHLAGGELHVMGLGAGLGKVLHRSERPCQPLGDELERIERHHDVQLTGLARGGWSSARGAAGCRNEEQAQGHTGGNPPRNHHENHFHLGASLESNRALAS
jgi:hypothetical protein